MSDDQVLADLEGTDTLDFTEPGAHRSLSAREQPGPYVATSRIARRERWGQPHAVGTVPGILGPLRISA